MEQFQVASVTPKTIRGSGVSQPLDARGALKHALLLREAGHRQIQLIDVKTGIRKNLVQFAREHPDDAA